MYMDSDRADLVLPEALLSDKTGIDDLQSFLPNISTAHTYAAAHPGFHSSYCHALMLAKLKTIIPPSHLILLWQPRSLPLPSLVLICSSSIQRDSAGLTSAASSFIHYSIRGFVYSQNEVGNKQHQHCSIVQLQNCLTIIFLREDRPIYTGTEWKNSS